MNESVYQGKNLEAWLRELEFETSKEQREAALLAVRRLVNDQNRDIVLDRISAMIRSRFTSEAVALLPLVTEDRYFEVLTSLMRETKSSYIAYMLEVSLTQSRISTQQYEGIDPFLTWMDEQMQPMQENDPFAIEARKAIRTVLNFNAKSRETTIKLIEKAESWNQFTNENFWLSHAEEGFSFPKDFQVAILAHVEGVLQNPSG